MTNYASKVSCICVTNGRPWFLARAIHSFAIQDYLNKEIVISYPANDHQTRDFLKQCSDLVGLEFLYIERSDDESVGSARNHAIARCNGSYVCVWDDDDWYHPNRLSYQYASLNCNNKSFNAAVLTRVLLYDSTTEKAYLSFSYCWENTLLCRKEIIFQNQYANKNRGEDSHIINFLDGKKFLNHIQDAPYLYIYVYHGANTWDYEHYKYLIKKSEPLDSETTARIKELI